MHNVQNYFRQQRIGRIIDAKFNVDADNIKDYRHDGYMNLLTQYGTDKDSSTQYQYASDNDITDQELTEQYTGNGLFAKIIDAPAEEAMKKGYDFGLTNSEIEVFIDDELDRLEWEEKVVQAMKWSRLYGGAIIVMIVNDGKFLDEPLDWDIVTEVEDLKVYERALVEPDYNSLYTYEPKKVRKYGAKFLEPEYFHVNSMYGSFTVHESRCLIFKNGNLPERVANSSYRFFGAPEFTRIKNALKDTIVAHEDGVKLLDRSVQAIYKMKNLAQKMSNDKTTEEVLKRLELIDLARGILSSIVIDAEGEDYDFKSMQLSGVKDIIDTTCNMLSALTNIPQTILFGRSPAGENSTGDSDLENYYNYVAKIQKLMLRKNTRILLDLIFECGKKQNKIQEVPPYKTNFVPLWSMSEEQKANVDAVKATTEQTKATTAQIYIEAQVLESSEVRETLKKNEEFTINDVLDEEDDLDFADLLGIGDITDEETITEEQQDSDVNTAKNNQSIQITKDIENNSPSQKDKATDSNKMPVGVGVLVIKDGKVLVGNRTDGKGICGPGGHVEQGESERQAAIRETIEEFNIIPQELISLGETEGMQHELSAHIFLCTKFAYEPRADNEEMKNARFIGLDEISRLNLFGPFKGSINLLIEKIGGE